jgi:hypothetical protein
LASSTAERFASARRRLERANNRRASRDLINAMHFKYYLFKDKMFFI